MADRLRAILVGAGKIGLGYARDPVMARHFRYAAHAQVLSDHPAFEWVGVSDSAPEALDLAKEWNVPLRSVAVADLAARCHPDVAVIATPPEVRQTVLDALPSVRAVLVEKPLGQSIADGDSFLRECERRQVLVQVNLWRRADRACRELATGRMRDLIGIVQSAHVVYGNGLLNNGTHMIDLVRMLLGEVSSVGVCAGARHVAGGPIPGDVSIPFWMNLTSGAQVTFQPLDFRHFREIAIDVWGDRGRLLIDQEGLRIQAFPRLEHRAMQGEREIASDKPIEIAPTAGDALYEMYTNLAEALRSGAALYSPGRSALETTKLVDNIFAAATTGRRGLVEGA